jgi:hypothetical protein
MSFGETVAPKWTIYAQKLGFSAVFQDYLGERIFLRKIKVQTNFCPIVNHTSSSVVFYQYSTGRDLCETKWHCDTGFILSWLLWEPWG